jgi:hypothetical protein
MKYTYGEVRKHFKSGVGRGQEAIRARIKPDSNKTECAWYYAYQAGLLLGNNAEEIGALEVRPNRAQNMPNLLQPPCWENFVPKGGENMRRQARRTPASTTADLRKLTHLSSESRESTFIHI